MRWGPGRLTSRPARLACPCDGRLACGVRDVTFLQAVCYKGLSNKDQCSYG
jgi:hypothetical protein